MNDFLTSTCIINGVHQLYSFMEISTNSTARVMWL